MGEWEFTYIDLLAGGGNGVSDVHATQKRIADLGLQGWEPVGEVGFLFFWPGHERQAPVPQLMFKRPIG